MKTSQLIIIFLLLLLQTVQSHACTPFSLLKLRFLTQFQTRVSNVLLIFVLALSISVKTTINTAAVYFVYDGPKIITHFEATIEYLDSEYKYEGDGCSVKVATSPLRCSIQNLYEAVDFNVIARACNNKECERPVVMRERTTLRGLSYWFFCNFFAFLSEQLLY